MAESRLPTPHNNLFRFSLSQIPTVRSLIETQFPSRVVEELMLDTLALEKDSFIDPQLRESYSDLLFSVMLRNPRFQNERALVYILFEHKSHSDRLTAFQMLKYIVRIWEQGLRNNLPLCPILPFVVYHGDDPWNAPKRIEDLIPAPEAFGEFSVRFGFPLLDLSQTDDDRLIGEPFLQCVLRLLKYGRSPKLLMELKNIFQLLTPLGISLDLKDRLEAIVVYIMTVNNSIPIEDLQTTIHQIFAVEIEPGSIADKFRQEGLQKGREEGREEGEQRGALIGTIQTCQSLLGEATFERESLSAKTVEDLALLADQLQAKLRRRYKSD